MLILHSVRITLFIAYTPLFAHGNLAPETIAYHKRWSEDGNTFYCWYSNMPSTLHEKNFYAKCWLAISPTGQHIVYVQTLVPISRYNVCTLSSAYKRKSCLPAIINLHTELFSTNLFILCDLYAPLACSGEEHLPFVSHHAEHLHNIVHGLERFATFDAPHVAGCFPSEWQRKQIGHTTAYCVLL